MATISANAATAYTPSVSPTNPNSSLASQDFLDLLITQLQNQDPLDPMKNNELLGQVTQIGTLQSQQELSTSLKEMVLQNQISSASGMIGKLVAGTDSSGEVLSGVVASIKVVDNDVTLQLDNGHELSLDHVTGVTTVANYVGGGSTSQTSS